MKRFIIYSLLVFLLATPGMAQEQTHSLSEGELADFRENVGRMIDRFQNCLSILGSKDQSKEVKRAYREQTLKLFIEEGKPYQDVYGNEQRAVHIQVSSLSQSRPKNVPVPLYLDRLINLPYAKVEITQAETFHLGELKQVDDHYETTAIIFQKFCGYSAEGRKKYCDTTRKAIRIYLIPDPDDRGKKWIVKFGDVDVTETTN